nr:histone-lysine N-methyltransferase SETMAR-like [Dasypus novemcinctus]
MMTSSVVGPRKGSKALPKGKLAPKKGHGHCLVVCYQSVPLQLLNLCETITFEKYAQQIYEVHRKLQQLQPALVNIKGLILLHENTQLHIAQPMLQKLNELGYKVLPHLPYSPDLLPTDYHFFQHLNNFLQRKHCHNQQDAEYAFQEFVES